MQYSFFLFFLFSVRKSSKRAKTGPKMVEIPLFTPGGQVKKMQVKSKRCWEGLMAHMGGPKAHMSGLKAHRGGLKAYQTPPKGPEFEGRIAPSNSSNLNISKHLLTFQ